jgi:hypothetical protein
MTFQSQIPIGNNICFCYPSCAGQCGFVFSLENAWETESSYGMFDGDNEKKIRRRANGMKDTWNEWAAKIFG